MIRINFEFDVKLLWCEIFHRKHHEMIVKYWVHCTKCNKHPRVWAWKKDF